MSLQYPLINRHTYSFTSIELTVADVVCLGVTEVNYKESINSVPIYGSDPRRVGRTVGQRKMTADLSLLRREWDVLLGRLGGNFGRVQILVVVSYAEGRDQPVITDTISGYIDEVDSSNQEGIDPAAVKLTLDPTDITWDGKSLEERPAGSDGSFWLQDETGIEGDLRASNPWDTVVLGGQQLPGVCVVKGQPTLAFDKKKAGGIDGATITVSGYLPGPIEIEVLLWTPAQMAAMRTLSPKIWRKPNKQTTAKDLALSISNPAFALWGINAVVVLGVSLPERGPLEGTKVVRIKCVEYVPTVAKPKTKTAKAATTVPDAPELDLNRNKAGPPPSKTDIHPGGPGQSHTGGVS